MKKHMVINGKLESVRWCDSTHHEPRFATTQLGWTERVVSDYCDECAVAWQAYAKELGGATVVREVEQPQAILKRGVA